MTLHHVAITRAVPDSFVEALSRAPRPINLEKARKQHRAYVAALQTMFDEVIVLPADESQPDCVFVEDQAVVLNGHALLCRVGHERRRGEAGPIREALEQQGLILHAMAEPATLDGGDVLAVGDTLYVGRSERTNDDGRVMLARVFGPLGFTVAPLSVSNLHLKSSCSSPLDGLVLVAPNSIGPERFSARHVLVVPEAEAYGANAVGHDGTVLLPGGCPQVKAALEELGARVVEVGTSEIRKADGALTCGSLRFAVPRRAAPVAARNDDA